LIIFLLVITILLYNLLLGLFTGEKANMLSASLTYLIVYGLLVVPFGALNLWIEQTIPLLSAILALASIVAFVFLMIELFSILGLGKGKKDAEGNSDDVLKDNVDNNKIDTDKSDLTGKDLENKDLKPKTLDNNTGINPHIKKLAGYLPTLKQAASEYAVQGKLIVDLHRGKVKGRGELPQDWLDFNNMEQRVLDGINAFSQAAHAIINDPAYATFTPQDFNALTIVMQDYSRITGGMLIFYNEMVNAYNDNTKPIPGNPF
jgi:hypothetical protein